MKNFIKLKSIFTLIMLFAFGLTAIAQQQHTITGRVTDSKGEGVPMVNILVVGTSQGTNTDVDGKYVLNVPSVLKNPVLSFSFVGYKTKEEPINNRDVINVVLEEEANQLGDAVVVAFGTQKKASVVGSLQSVKPAELKVPSAQLSTSFAGRLAGVIAVQRSGQPGADGADFWIRGISTFAGTTSPLIVIDGVQVSSQDLNTLDPEVIESFSILKDATATALYGTRGANGVMIVTTKSGRDLDKPIVNVRLENAFVSPTKIPKIADGVNYMQMYNEAVTNRGTGEVLYSQEKIDGTAAGLDPLLYPNVQWYDELFKDLSMNQNMNLNIRGGGKKADYFLSASVNHESGMLKDKSRDYFSYNNNMSVWRYAFQNNINVYLTKSTTVSLHLNTQLRSRTGPLAIDGSETGIFGLVMQSNPVDFPIIFPNDDARETISNPRERYAWGGKVGGTYNNGFRNPMAELTRGYMTNFQSTVIANLDLDQKLDFVTEGLSFKALASFKNWTTSSVTRSSSYNQYFISDYTLGPDGNMETYKLSMQGDEQSEVLGTSGSTGGDRRLYLQAMVNYNRTFAKDHNVSGMFMYSQDEVNTNAPTDLYTSLPYRKQGIAGRVTYGYKYRYLLEFNFGYNGSENFAKGHRFGFFPSIGGGYAISEEPFWDKIKPIISNLKLRGSWGKVGNDQIGGERFIYLSDINLQSSDPNRGYTTGVDMNYTLYGPNYRRYQNNNITWEVGDKINAGIDIQLFNSLNIMVDGFREVRSNIFLARQTIPAFLGTASTTVYGNLGELKNHGFDASIDYGNRFGKDLYISFKATFTYAKNEITKYDEPAYMAYPNTSRVGHSVNQMLMYQAERLFIDDAEVANSALVQLGGAKSRGGDIKYTDLPDRNGNKSGTIDANDRQYLGYPTVPQIMYGFGPSVKWKNWDASFFFQGAAQTSLMMSGFHPFGSSYIRNVLQFVADDYWSPTNQNVYAEYPRLSKQDNPNNTASSTYWQRDASFLKLKNAEIGYTYKFARIYVNGSNLLTFSKFKLWDPEQGGGAGFSYPTQRVINIGLQMTL